MTPWDIIGWAIAVPLIVLSVIFVYAVSVAVVRVTVNRGKRQQSKSASEPTALTRHETVSKGRHLRPTK